MKITIIDSIICRTDSLDILRPMLQIEKAFWKKNPATGRKEEIKYMSPLVNKKGEFLSGFLPGIIETCKKKNIPVEIEGEFEKLEFNGEINPPGISLHLDQKNQIEPILNSQRGVLKAPTGTGKTILTYAIIMAFAKPVVKKTLVICPSISIMRQTAKEFKERFCLNVSKVGEGEKDLSGDIVMSIINSMANMPPEEYCDIFDIVIIDECHHAASFDGQFYKVMTNLLAPVKIGLTATVYDKKSTKRIACEGLIGPVIDEFTIEDAINNDRLTKPRLKLISVPKHSGILPNMPYKTIYKIAITENRLRNALIAKFIFEEIHSKNKTALVFTRIVEHAETLFNLFEQKGIECEIVTGSTDGEERDVIKEALEIKNISTVIATSAWKEGVNLPNLDCVVLAAGYKSEVTVVQMAGRVLRKAEGKEEAVIVDFLDSGKYISEHSIERLQIYQSLGLLK